MSIRCRVQSAGYKIFIRWTAVFDPVLFLHLFSIVLPTTQPRWGSCCQP